MSTLTTFALVSLAMLASLFSVLLLAVLCHGALAAIELRHCRTAPVASERRLHAAAAGLHAGLFLLALVGV